MRWPFAAWGADAVFTGHEHLFERISQDGILYFVNGAGGAGLYNFEHIGEVQGSQKRYNSNFGAQLVSLTKAEAKYEFFSINGEQIDSIKVPKSCP